MKQVHSLYFICEDGHLTVGDNRRTKCSFTIKHMRYEKDSKNKFKGIEWKETECSKKIVETQKIPAELKLAEVWDNRTMEAFLIDQKVGADFVIDIQKAITGLYKMLKK